MVSTEAHRGIKPRPRVLSFLGAAILLLALPSAASAAAGDLDPSFAGDGIAIDSSTPGATSVAMDSAGRIVVLCHDVVLRFRPSGKLDKSFSGDGRAHIPFEGDGASVATDPQDRIVVAGTVATPGDTHHKRTFAVGRLKSNGSPDPSFSGDGQVVTQIGGLASDYARGVTIDDQGRIVVAGSSYTSSGNGNFAVARYRTNGSPDTSFSGNGQTRTRFPGDQDAFGAAVAIDSKGRITVAGGANGSTSDDFAVASYTPAGNLDHSFSGDGTLTTQMAGPGSVAIGRSVAIDDLDRIVVGGDSEGGSDDFALARYRPNGALDPAFSGDGKGFASFGGLAIGSGIAIDNHQRIVAAGSNRTDDGTRSSFALARFTRGGALDPAFSGDGRVTTSIGSHAECAALALDSQGRIVAAGNTNHAVVARYLGG